MEHPTTAGKFIVIEGLEGAGKSSAIALVKQFLTELNAAEPVCTREPGGTIMAEKIRTLVKEVNDEDPLCDEAECLLMYAARAQLVANVIKPALSDGKWVLGDRHNLSSLAYQGGGRGMLPLVQAISDATLKGFTPDLTLYLDIPPALGLQRAANRGALDRIEQQAIDFFDRARATYLAIAEGDANIEVIDASQTMDKVHQDIVAVLTRRLTA